MGVLSDHFSAPFRIATASERIFSFNSTMRSSRPTNSLFRKRQMQIFANSLLRAIHDGSPFIPQRMTSLFGLLAKTHRTASKSFPPVLRLGHSMA
jgi:hypothetical protein